MARGGIVKQKTFRVMKVPVNAPILERKLYGLQEIQILLGVSRSRAQCLIDRPDFPEPIETLARGRIWNPADVLDWAEDSGRIVIVPLPTR